MIIGRDNDAIANGCTTKHEWDNSTVARSRQMTFWKSLQMYRERTVVGVSSRLVSSLLVVTHRHDLIK